MYRDIFIPQPSQGVVEGHKAQVAFTVWNSPDANPEGSVQELLGPKGENSVEMHAIVLEHGFATSFPEAVLAEAKVLEKQRVIPEAEIARRRDFRGTTTFTIDPADAKD